MPELLLVARRDEHLAKFWQYAKKDEADAPRAMKELIAGRGSVKVTEQEAREALAWCDGRVGWIPTPGRLPFFGPYAVSVVTRASQRAVEQATERDVAEASDASKTQETDGEAPADLALAHAIRDKAQQTAVASA